MHVDELPPSIKEWFIPIPPEKYEGWLYKFTCLISNRYYIGIHKDDGTIYWHSSENEEFQNIFANKDSNLKYEILEYGDYEDLMQFLACQTPDLVKQIFVVHGEADVQDHFAERLRKKGFKEVIVPEMHETFVME